MASKKHQIKGKAMWAEVFESNAELKDYQGVPHSFGKLFKIDLMLDKEGKALYKSSGTAGKGKFDDDGNFIATLKRKEKDRFEWASGAPNVTNVDGSKWSYQEDGFIPNGSIVEADFTVYTTSMSPGTRLEAVRIIELAEKPDLPERSEAPVVTTTPKASASIEVPF